MKIKEVRVRKSKSQLNELQLSSILGDYGAAQQSQAFGFGGGRTKQDIMTQNIFIKNFVSNAISNLQTAIKGGIVDPKKTTPRKATAADFDGSGVAQQGDIGDWNLKDKMSKQKADQEQYRKDQEIANVGKERMARAASSPESPQASAAVDARMQRATQAQQNQTPPLANVADKLDRAAAQRGQNIPTPQNTPRNKQPLPKYRGPSGIDESRYQYLNLIFEAILETVLPDQYENGTMTINQYLSDVWLPNYMKGVDLSTNKQKIDQIIKQVGDTYSKDGGRGALTQLANLSYAISPRKDKPKQKEKPETKPAVSTPAAQPAAEKPEIPVVSIGKDKYTKSERGWMNDKKELVSAAMAQTLDQIYAKQSQEPAAEPTTTAPAPTDVPKATDADFAPVEPDRQKKLPLDIPPQSNITQMPKRDGSRTGTYKESKLIKHKIRK